MAQHPLTHARRATSQVTAAENRKAKLDKDAEELQIRLTELNNKTKAANPKFVSFLNSPLMALYDGGKVGAIGDYKRKLDIVSEFNAMMGLYEQYLSIKVASEAEEADIVKVKSELEALIASKQAAMVADSQVAGAF